MAAEAQPPRSVHLVGIGGAGMCGIAEVLLALGCRVSGSDIADSAATRRLAALGATVHRGHAAPAVGDADVVVASTAIDAANPELAAARARGIRILARAEMLAELMRGRFGIAIAGSHGKTTTAGLLAGILDAAGLQPSYVIGGAVAAEGRNARLGAGRHLIAEADESDASFLHLQPQMAVVTNIDRDHLATYGHDFAVLRRAFADFARRLPADGALVLCADDAQALQLRADAPGPVRTYGLSPQADVRAIAIAGDARLWRFAIARAERAPLRVALPLPGLHNARNALAAVAAAELLDVPDAAIAAGLAGFGGIERRFAVRDCELAGKRLTVIDDYGHHPTEIRCVIDTVRRLWPRRRLAMVFQPHRYTRTRDLLDAFAEALCQADALLLIDVYAAGEAPIDGADGAALAAAVRRIGTLEPHCAATPEEALARLPGWAAADDVLVVQGAGDIDRVAAALAAPGASP